MGFAGAIVRHVRAPRKSWSAYTVPARHATDRVRGTVSGPPGPKPVEPLVSNSIEPAVAWRRASRFRAEAAGSGRSVTQRLQRGNRDLSSTSARSHPLQRPWRETEQVTARRQVYMDLCDEALGVVEATFLAQTMCELDPESGAVKVALEVE